MTRAAALAVAVGLLVTLPACSPRETRSAGSSAVAAAPATTARSTSGSAAAGPTPVPAASRPGPDAAGLAALERALAELDGTLGQLEAELARDAPSR